MYRRLKRIILSLIILVVVAINTVAFMHAYTFTHFTCDAEQRTSDPKLLSSSQKVKTLFLGIDNPRPANTKEPALPYETIYVRSTGKLECWHIPADSSKGTVILFHGYADKKSSLLNKSYEFHNQGYSVFLVDFLGSGGSEGNSTSIGYHEAEQVKACYDFLAEAGESTIFLYGTSMGAVACLRAASEYDIQPAAIMAECPFGSLYKTTCARFRNMGLPAFPFAGLLLFWGGVQNNFWAFGHNPSSYAKAVSCPVLLLLGEQDDRVSVEEVKGISNSLRGEKEFCLFPEAGHNNIYSRHYDEWTSAVHAFVSSHTGGGR